MSKRLLIAGAESSVDVVGFGAERDCLLKAGGVNRTQQGDVLS